MPNMHRTPPKSPKTPRPGQSQSVPDIASASSCDAQESNANETVRGKRPRIDDSPNNLVMDSSCAWWEWKSELMQLLTKWRTEHDLKLSTWKAEHDAMLSTLVRDVSDIKKQCADIQQTTIELEVRMRSASLQKRARGKDPEKRHQETQDLNIQSRSAPSQLLTAPPDDIQDIQEVVPMSIAPEGLKAVDRETRETCLRDIDHQGKRVSSASCPASKPRVVLPVSAAVVDVTMCDIDQEVQLMDGWTEVRHRRSRRSLGNVLRGTAAPGTTNLEASERWRYLHLFYVKQGTSDSQVRDHLTTICGADVCTVEALKSRGKYASFKLGVPSKLAEQVMAAQNWAEDICIKPWRRNFRGRSNEAQ